MLNKRIFIGIPLSEELSTDISEFQKKNSGVKDIRWVGKSNLHVTLCFIGDYPVKDLEKLYTRIQDIVKSLKPFSLEFDKFQFGPNYSKAYMIWLKFHDNPSFINLASSLNKSFLSNSLENKILAHITIARFKQINKEMVTFDSIVSNPFLTVQSINIYESILQSSGAEYLILKTINFL